MAVILRYFDAQGRAQALRNALTNAGIAFEDVRVTLATWPLRREDPGFSGLFAARPTRFTASPDEPTSVDRIRGYDLASIGL